MSLLPAWTFLLAAAVTFAATPLAAAVARRTGFYDHPDGYKDHGRPTAYLGGAAVLLGVAVAAVLASGATPRFWPLLAGAAGLLALGTLDDRVGVMPRWRIAAEVGLALALARAGLGWELFESELANAMLTVIWVVGVVNAFNLMDNLDGAAPTVGAVCAAGIGALALTHGDVIVAALALAVAGACAGFLPHNLSRPARIFLGDGGSMPLGLLLAGLAVAASQHDGLGALALLAGAMLVGLLILDTALVSLSRTREGIPLVTAGRDHLTHRILMRLRSERRVALALAITQALLCGLAIAGESLGPLALGLLAALAITAGAAALLRLDSPTWKPARPRPQPAFPTVPPAVAVPMALPAVSPLEVALESPQPSRAEA
jgi:UDP-GlcNAc:undecaprenyl-phosphate GlcNAc-1-phosphate transferase